MDRLVDQLVSQKTSNCREQEFYVNSSSVGFSLQSERVSGDSGQTCGELLRESPVRVSSY